MAAMDLKVGNAVIGKALSTKKLPTAQKVVNTALDGTAYVQITGNPILRYSVNCYCATPEMRDAVDAASNEGAEITLIMEDSTEITGYIEEPTVSWKEWKDGHGVGRFTLIKQ